MIEWQVGLVALLAAKLTVVCSSFETKMQRRAELWARCGETVCKDFGGL